MSPIFKIVVGLRHFWSTAVVGDTRLTIFSRSGPRLPDIGSIVCALRARFRSEVLDMHNPDVLSGSSRVSGLEVHLASG